MAKEPEQDLEFTREERGVIEKAFALILEKGEIPGTENPLDVIDDQFLEAHRAYFDSRHDFKMAILVTLFGSGNLPLAEMEEKAGCSNGCAAACKISCISGCLHNCKGSCKSACVGDCEGLMRH
ncbi:hypothetical protein GGD81_001778 [Rhodobium orientis]|uniref:Uncharacterized protein n=1 Tax=Rhodobium orientis TaxID=34017 RepID=A0A327JXU3_9HYPH|nr:hypothetical protein [Rhodobium orientis]MBB4302742.1 hypothetical protein [Rhodobium orientis]MBK5948523.1 hypothetical protein [Rhodobium orientis]RAI29792.1 hypothetical protein CH339_01885 [Rhodobium orientis]